MFQVVTSMVCNFSQLNNKLFEIVVNKDKAQNAIMIVAVVIFLVTLVALAVDVTTHESERFN